MGFLTTLQQFMATFTKITRIIMIENTNTVKAYHRDMDWLVERSHVVAPGATSIKSMG